MRVTAIIAAFAAIVGAAQAGGWHYGLPDSGLAPSYGKMEFYTRMAERHGEASDFSLQSYALTIPLADPRKSGFGDTLLNMQLDAKVSIINGGGTFRLENETLYNLALPITFITPMGNGNRWTYGAAPEMAADSETISKGLDLTLYAFYTIKNSEHFNYSLGLAASPRFAEYLVLPMVRFEWTPNERWSVDLNMYELRALYHATNRLAVGPFMSARGGVWAVETERGARMLRVRSLVAGVTMEYDFSQPGQTKRVITAALGSPITSHAQFCNRTAGKDAYESHHYKPGLYIAVGVDFRF